MRIRTEPWGFGVGEEEEDQLDWMDVDSAMDWFDEP